MTHAHSRLPSYTGKVCLAAILVLAGFLISGSAQPIGPAAFDQLKFRYIGPIGNRVSAVVGIPGDSKTYYAGGASGGIWKTTDAGIHWKPVFDDQIAQSIGSLAVAPSDPNIIWAGTGEAHLRSNISLGNGIYKSPDGGRTWTHMGLERSGRIGRIVIDPGNPDVAFAAALGHCYGPQQERGIYRTKDGGKTWDRVLFVDENTGGAELAMDPHNPQILFAGMWQIVIRTWGRESGGPGSGLFVSRDGGSTWRRLSGHGLPGSPLGKIAVAVAPSNSKRVYALIETGDGVPWKGQPTSNGVFWKSDDGGENWELVSTSHELSQRPHYYSRFVVAPDKEDEVYFCAVQHLVSFDGGRTVRRMPRAGRGDDHHDMWIDPADPDRMIVGSDHHVNISVNRGQTWLAVALPVAQMYHVAVDDQIPYFVYGTRQDGPSVRGPSDSLMQGWSGAELLPGLWRSVGGFEGGWSIPDPVDNNIVWSGAKGGGLDRYDLRTGHARSVKVWPDSREGTPAAEVKYRFQWTFPIAISPHDHNKVYVGSQFVHQTTDSGQSWTVISPDLSTNDKSKQGISGGLTPDNDSPEYGCVIFAIAESSLEKGVIWAGTNDGLVQVTRDGGAHWANVTANIPDLPPWGTVSCVEPSRYEPGTCYIAVDFHQVNDRNPYVYKTEDYGRTWKGLSSDIPRSLFSYVHCIREDPVRKGLLYLGTENGLYVSLNDGTNWQSLQLNLPHAPVHWLVVQERFHDLVVATYGRGFWILDDLTPLEQTDPKVLDTTAYLFAPRPAYRFLSRETVLDQPDNGHAGQNPSAGAVLNYYLKDAPPGDVKMTVANEQGQIVRTLAATKTPGFNRVWWDLRIEPASRIRLRTSPIFAPQVGLGPEGWRPLPGGGGSGSARVAPGTYTIRLTVEGQEFVRTLNLRKDPGSSGSEADIQAQQPILLDLREMSNTTADIINRIETLRRQIYDLSDSLKAERSAASVRASGEKLDQKLIALEGELIELRLTGGSQDWLRWPARFYAKLGSLVGSIAGTDYPPTASEIEVYEMYKKQMAGYKSRYDDLLRGDVSAFNDLLTKSKLPPLAIKD